MDEQERRQYDEVMTEGMSDVGKRAYDIREHGTSEQKDALDARIAEKQREAAEQERIKYNEVMTEGMSDAGKRAYDIREHGTPEQKDALDARIAEKQREAAEQERREYDKFVRRATNKNEEKNAISAPLKSYLEEGLPSNAQELKQTLKEILYTETKYLAPDQPMEIIRKFLDDYLGKTLDTLRENEEKFSSGDHSQVSKSVSEYLRVVSALYDIGYPKLNMQNEYTYSLQNDRDSDLGFKQIMQYFTSTGQKIQIQLPRDYDEEYPQNYADPTQIMLLIGQDIRDKGRNQNRWRLMGYVAPDVLKDQLADKSIEERFEEAESEIRSIKAYAETNSCEVPKDLKGRVKLYKQQKKIEKEKIEKATEGVTTHEFEEATSTIKAVVHERTNQPSQHEQYENEEIKD